MRATICLCGLLAGGMGVQAHAAVDCSPAALALRQVELPATVSQPVSAELQIRQAPLGMPSGVLAVMHSPEQSLERVLQRLRIEGCQDVAAAVEAAAPAPTVPMGAAIDPAAYKPQTAFDNTPWRFDMSQNGKRMTAEEFDAWMKARGVRVVQPRQLPGQSRQAEEPRKE